ncbi:unnamed protein product [Rotaria sordida]|uniref:SET domain-containing protein n=1 Tax=Rotaria sordida TaxID=392033 RepID=A0A814WKE0_9BILA|nr:unnamed protein product [Rotaria sordida]
MATTPLDTAFIAKSTLPRAGYGAFAARRIAKDTYFGPYGGLKHNDSLIAETTGYAWTIKNELGELIYFIDAFDPNNSNWLRFINSANTARQQNLVAVKHLDEIFYLATRNIDAGEELLVYYGHTFAELLGSNVTDFS